MSKQSAGCYYTKIKNNIFPLKALFSKKIKFEHVEDWCGVYVYI